VPLEAAVWVCADIETTAKPKKTVMAPRISSVFIKILGVWLNFLQAGHLTIAARD
jgi:hypothetical protein